MNNKSNKTVMQLWCEYRNWQGGTIHQALYEFCYKLSDRERDQFCGILADRITEISDKHNAQDFMRERLSRNGLHFPSGK